MPFSRRSCPFPAVLAVLLAVGPSLHAADRVDLTGTWVLNKDRSDAIEDKDRGKPTPKGLGAGPGMGGSGPMGGAGINGPLMGGRSVDPGLKERMRELARIAFDSPDELVVTEEGDTIRFVDDERHATRLTPNGEKTQEAIGALQIERRTRWEKGRLVTEVKLKDGGGEVKRTYARDGDRLVIEGTFEGEVAARTEKMKFVYDRKGA